MNEGQVQGFDGVSTAPRLVDVDNPVLRAELEALARRRPELGEALKVLVGRGAQRASPFAGANRARAARAERNARRLVAEVDGRLAAGVCRSDYHALSKLVGGQIEPGPAYGADGKPSPRWPDEMRAMEKRLQRARRLIARLDADN